MSEPSAALAAALARAAEPACPAHLGLMHILIAATNEAEARNALDRASASAPTLDRVAACWAGAPEAWTVVRSVLAEARHDAAPSSPHAAVEQWARVFDALARDRPEAGVALYALGDPALLEEASREVVRALAQWGALRAGARVIDLGCGIGRLARHLAAAGAEVLGLDVSAGMVAEARRRCADLPDVRFEQTTGRDLNGVGDASLDLVLAVDVFPYLVQAGGALAADHVAEAARVLRAGGHLVVANVSYRGDDARDAADLAAWATSAGLSAEAAPERPFRLWDGLVFRFRKA